MRERVENAATPLAGKRDAARDEEIAFERGDLFTMNGDARGVQIVVTKGRLWVTQSGDAEDHVLRAGERYVVDRKGLVLAQGLREGRARLVRAA